MLYLRPNLMCWLHVDYCRLTVDIIDYGTSALFVQFRTLRPYKIMSLNLQAWGLIIIPWHRIVCMSTMSVENFQICSPNS